MIIADILIAVPLVILALFFLAKLGGKGAFGFKSNKERLRDINKK